MIRSLEQLGLRRTNVIGLTDHHLHGCRPGIQGLGITSQTAAGLQPFLCSCCSTFGVCSFNQRYTLAQAKKKIIQKKEDNLFLSHKGIRINHMACASFYMIQGLSNDQLYFRCQCRSFCTVVGAETWLKLLSTVSILLNLYGFDGPNAAVARKLCVNLLKQNKFLIAHIKFVHLVNTFWAVFIQKR